MLWHYDPNVVEVHFNAKSYVIYYGMLLCGDEVHFMLFELVGMLYVPYGHV